MSLPKTKFIQNLLKEHEGLTPKEFFKNLKMSEIDRILFVLAEKVLFRLHVGLFPRKQ